MSLCETCGGSSHVLVSARPFRTQRCPGQHDAPLGPATIRIAVEQMLKSARQQVRRARLIGFDV